MMNPRSALERFKVFERSSQYSIDLTGQVDIVDGFIVRGGCGTVYKGILRDNRVEVAIKVPPGGVSRDETVIKRFLEEVHVWSELSHQNVLPYFGITTQLNFTVSLVSQWMYKGNAHDYVQDVTVDPRPLIEGIAHGLHYLHYHQPFPIFHGNMKGTNVLISDKGQPLLADFGSTLNFVCSSSASPCFGAVGNLRWNAPEMLEVPSVSAAADVWAFGMTILELFIRRDPYYNLRSMASIVMRITQGPPDRPSARDTLSRMTDKWWNMCLTCWQCDPKLRPSMSYFVENIAEITVPLKSNAQNDPDPHSVPPEFKKEGADWVAVFNPKVRRVLDVSLMHTLMHESVVCCVRFSADGKYLATGCNRTAQIYDTTTGLKTCVLADESAGKVGDLYIRSVCFSPDGKYLATGAEDKQIRIWDIGKKRIRHIFDGHKQEIYSLDFSLDGRLLVSGSGDRTARIWDIVENTSKVLTINDPDALNNDAYVSSVVISPNGQLVAVGYLDTFVRIWDISTGHLVERLGGHRDSVYSVAFTPDGKGLVSGSLDKTLKYWDVSGLLAGGTKHKDSSANGRKDLQKPSQCTMNFVGHTDFVLSVAVSPDGQWIVSGSKDRGVQFWDAHSAMMQCMLQGHKNSVISVDLSPVGNMLATGSGDRQARIWSYQTTTSALDSIAPVSTAPNNGQLPDDPDLSVPLELEKEGADWVAVFNPKVKRVLDVSLVYTLMHESIVRCVRFSTDGKYLATGCNRTAQIYDTKTGLKTCVLADESADKARDLYIRSICFSPDGKYLATGADDNLIRIWDIAKERMRTTFDGHHQEVYSMDFSIDGRLIASGSGDATVRIWDMVENTCKVLAIDDPDALKNDPGVASVAISPNGQLVAAGYLDTFVRIWDISTGHLIERLRGHQDSVYSVTFTPDGKGLVSGSLDKTLKYWDVSGLLAGGENRRDSPSNGKKDLQKPSHCTMNFVGHTDYVISVAVSPDGQWVVSGSRDRGVQFWDAHSAVIQCMLQGHMNTVLSVDFSPVGNMLATGSGDWKARIWSYKTITPEAEMDVLSPMSS